MKNKILLGFLVLVLVVSAFFGGRFFERQRIKKETSIQNTSNPLPAEASAKAGTI